MAPKYYRNSCDLFAKMEDVLVSNWKKIKKKILEEFHNSGLGMLLGNSQSWKLAESILESKRGKKKGIVLVGYWENLEIEK